MDEWVYGCEDRAAYIDRYLRKFGSSALNSIKAKPFYSAPANYGAAVTSRWARDGREIFTGLTLPELETVLREGGNSMSKPYTLQELLIIAVAKEIHDYENVILGIGIPTTAGALAKALYAPNATLMMESGIVDFQPLLPLNHIADAHACRASRTARTCFPPSPDLPRLRGRVLPRRRTDRQVRQRQHDRHRRL